MQDIKFLILIGCAGCLGTLARFGMIRLAHGWLPNFPLGTLIVNILGAFLAGLIFMIFQTHYQQYSTYLPIILIGFLGAFTTFSTFVLESSRFLLDAQYLKFISNIALQNISGVIAVCGGIALGKWLV